MDPRTNPEADPRAAGGGATETGTYLVVSLGKKMYAVDARMVREVLSPSPWAVVPAAGRTVAGAMFVRGVSVTLFDLGWRLTGTRSTASRTSRIVVLREPRWAALLVDGALALISGSPDKAPDASRPAGRDGPFLAGRVTWKGRPLGVVDIHRIVG